MKPHERRTHVRNYCQSPLMIAKFNRKGFYEATMYNISEGGMYFETDHALHIGDPVYIRITGDLPADYQAFVAEVRWRKKATQVSGYGMGVRYMARGHIFRQKRPNAIIWCDLCGRDIPLTDAHETEDALNLCTPCFKEMGTLINGKLKQSITRFACGNVI